MFRTFQENIIFKAPFGCVRTVHERQLGYLRKVRLGRFWSLNSRKSQFCWNLDLHVIVTSYFIRHGIVIFIKTFNSFFDILLDNLVFFFVLLFDSGGGALGVFPSFWLSLTIFDGDSTYTQRQRTTSPYRVVPKNTLVNRPLKLHLWNIWYLRLWALDKIMVLISCHIWARFRDDDLRFANCSGGVGIFVVDSLWLLLMVVKSHVFICFHI